MKKTLRFALTTVMLASFLSGCGNEITSEVAETSEKITATDVPEDVSESEDENVIDTDSEVPKEGEEQNETEPEILWYMDEEGLKNDDMGIIIRKDNAEIQDLNLSISVFLTAEGDAEATNSASKTTLSCNYYGGTLDDYINEYAGRIKAQAGNMEFAYDPSYPMGTAFCMIQNGIQFFFSYYTDDPVAFLEKLQSNGILKKYDDTNEALAYVASDGIYIPVMGICFSVDNEQADNVISSRSVGCFSSTQGDYLGDSLNINAYTGDSLLRYSSYSDAGEALDIINVFAEQEPYAEEDEYNAIDDILERTIGNTTFTGRGRNEKHGDYLNKDNWLFCSEDLKYVISFSYDEGDTLPSGEEVTPDYFLSFIEEY